MVDCCLQQLPQPVFELIIEFGIGTLSYAQNNRLNRKCQNEKKYQEAISCLVASGIWWANDPDSCIIPTNAFAIHWMTMCYPLMLTSHSLRNTVRNMSDFQKRSTAAENAVREYHKAERLAGFKAWFDERKQQIKEHGQDVLITIEYVVEPDPDNGYDEGLMEDQDDVMEEFPDLDMTDRKFYCRANNPVHNDGYYNYLRSCRISKQMNSQYQAFSPESYRCRFCAE